MKETLCVTSLRRTFLTLLLLITVSLSYSQQIPDISGFARASAYGGSKRYDYSSVFGEIAIRGNFTNKNSLFFTDTRLRSGINFGERFSEIEIKELYTGYKTGKIGVYLGNQIVTWGRADFLNPTDNISPSNRFFLSSDPDDQRLSNFMFRFKMEIMEGINGEIVLVPVYKPSEYRYDLFELGEDISFSSMTLPSKILRNSSFAIKLDFSFNRVDLSVSYFRGYDHNYGFRMVSFTSDITSGSFTIRNSATPYLKNTFGTDLAVTAGNFILKGEAALNMSSNYENEIHIPNPSVECVSGIETRIFNSTLSLEYICKYTFDFKPLSEPLPPDPGYPEQMSEYIMEYARYEFAQLNRKIFSQQKKYNHGISLNFTKNLFNENVETTLCGYYNLTSSEAICRGVIRWRINDCLSFTAGINYLSGPEKTPFYYTKDLISGVFTELRVSF
jgi:hypothetical protein